MNSQHAVAEAHDDAAVGRQCALVSRIQAKLDQSRLQLGCVSRLGVELQRELEPLPRQI
jgi:hypothetical protein